MSRLQIAKGILALARAEQKRDPDLAAYMVRDMPETEAAGLKDLAWSMHKQGNNHPNDAEFLLDKLEEYLDAQPTEVEEDA